MSNNNHDIVSPQSHQRNQDPAIPQPEHQHHHVPVHVHPSLTNVQQQHQQHQQLQHQHQHQQGQIIPHQFQPHNDGLSTVDSNPMKTAVTAAAAAANWSPVVDVNAIVAFLRMEAGHAEERARSLREYANKLLAGKVDAAGMI